MRQKFGGSKLTSSYPIIRYDAVIEAALDGTLVRAFAADKRAATGSTTLRKTGFIPSVAATPAGPSVLVNGDEVNLFARQARQRVEHAARMTKTCGIGLGSGDMRERAQADADVAALFEESRLRRIVPGFYAGVRWQ
jgi:hypothetical protein